MALRILKPEERSDKMTAPIGNKSNGIQVIARAANILRALGEAPDRMSLGQIAHKVDLPRSTVQRIVRALSVEGLVSAENGGGVRLGPQIQSLAQASACDTKDLLRPVLQRIAKETGETVDLAVLNGNKMLFIDQVVGSQRLRTVSSIGEKFPLTTTANGKAALACLDETEAARLAISEAESVGETNRKLPDILNEIEDIRNGALATDKNEHTDGISALGFAISDKLGSIYAISIPVPSSRFERLKPTLANVLSMHRSEIAQKDLA